MKKSEQKIILVEELTNAVAEYNVTYTYTHPSQDKTKDWIANTASILKGLDENDYQEFVRLSKTITPTEERENRKRAALEIESFLKRKAKEWKRYDFSSLDSENNTPKLTFGAAGNSGQAGRGGSIFIHAENFHMAGGGRITADGGNYTVNTNDIINFGTLNQTVAETINNITKLSSVVSESELKEAEKRQLIGDIETLKAQMIKPEPDKSIVQKAWAAIQIASTIGGAAQLLTMIGSAIAPIIY